MSVQWNTCDRGLVAVLPYDETDHHRVEAKLTIDIDNWATGGPHGLVHLDIRVEVNGLWTRESGSYKSVDEALAALEQGWRPALKRTLIAFAAWDAACDAAGEDPACASRAGVLCDCRKDPR